MARIGVDVGGTFTDLILETDGDCERGRCGPGLRPQGAEHA